MGRKPPGKETDMELRQVDYKSKVEDGKLYSSTCFGVSEHYTLEVYTIHRDGKEIYKRIGVEVSYEDRTENYIPEIYYQDDFYGKSKPRFEIQTTAYGTKSPEEIQKVIAGYQEAVEVVELLTKHFC